MPPRRTIFRCWSTTARAVTARPTPRDLADKLLRSSLDGFGRARDGGGGREGCQLLEAQWVRASAERRTAALTLVPCRPVTTSITDTTANTSETNSATWRTFTDD